MRRFCFREPSFHAAVEVSRWRAYPLGLAMVAEMVEGVLRAQVGDRDVRLESLIALVLAVFDRYAVPPAASASRSGASSAPKLERRLQLVGLHPPKRVMDIPEQWARTYFDLMPIHENLRTRDFQRQRNYLRVSLCNIHDEFVERLDARALGVLIRRKMGDLQGRTSRKIRKRSPFRYRPRRTSGDPRQSGIAQGACIQALHEFVMDIAQRHAQVIACRWEIAGAQVFCESASDRNRSVPIARECP